MPKAGGGGGGGKSGGGGKMLVAKGAAPSVDNQVEATRLEKYDKDNIKAYTGGKVLEGGERFGGLNAEELNRTLYNPTEYPPTAVSKNFEKILNASLDKVKDMKGEVYRTVVDESVASNALGLAANYVPGKTVTLKEFASTSRVKNNHTGYAYTKLNYGLRLKIQSKHGKAIAKISRFSNEREVLFKSGTTFHVTSRTWNQARSTWDITMTEI